VGIRVQPAMVAASACPPSVVSAHLSHYLSDTSTMLNLSAITFIKGMLYMVFFQVTPDGTEQ
jgi:hypothetical protein